MLLTHSLSQHQSHMWVSSQCSVPIAVASPFKVKQIITMSRCHIILALMWIISVALAIFVFFFIKLGFQVLAGIVIATNIALIISYSVVCYKTTKRNMASNASDNMQRRRRQSENEVLRYSVAVTITFMICIYPYCIEVFIGYQKYINLPSSFLFSVNPLLDTLLYFVLSYCKRRRERDRANTAPIENIQMSNCEAAQVITSRL